MLYMSRETTPELWIYESLVLISILFQHLCSVGRLKSEGLLYRRTRDRGIQGTPVCGKSPGGLGGPKVGRPGR